MHSELALHFPNLDGSHPQLDTHCIYGKEESQAHFLNE